MKSKRVANCWDRVGTGGRQQRGVGPLASGKGRRLVRSWERKGEGAFYPLQRGVEKCGRRRWRAGVIRKTDGTRPEAEMGGHPCQGPCRECVLGLREEEMSTKVDLVPHQDREKGIQQGMLR